MKRRDDSHHVRGVSAFVVTALAASLATVFSLGCGSAIDRGQSAYVAGDFESASEYAERALLDDHSLEAFVLAIDIALQLRNYTVASDQLDAARFRYPVANELWERELLLATRQDDAVAYAIAWMTLDLANATPAVEDSALTVAADAFSRAYRGSLRTYEIDDIPARALRLLESILNGRQYEALSLQQRDHIQSGFDVGLYRWVYTREYERADADREHLAAVVGADAFIVQKHEIVTLLEQRRPEALRRLAELAGGDESVLRSLAFEFDARDANIAAAHSYAALAELRVGDDAADTYLRAAVSAYGGGYRVVAQEQLNNAISVADDVGYVLLAAFYTADDRNDEAYGAQLLNEHLAALTCADIDAGDLAAAEALRAAGRIESVDVMGAQQGVLNRIAECRTTCATGVGPDAIVDLNGVTTPCAADVVFRLAEAAAEAFRERQQLAFALDFYRLAFDEDPTSMDVVSRMLSVTENLGLHEEAERVARGHVAACADSGLLSERSVAVRVVNTLGTSNFEGVLEVQRELLDTIVSEHPGEWSIVRLLADAYEEAGLGEDRRALLTRFAEASEQPLAARFTVGQWARHSFSSRLEAAEYIEALATEPGADDVASPSLGAGDTVAEAAWLMAADLRSELGDSNGTIDALQGFAALRGVDERQTYEVLWAVPGLRSGLTAPAMVWLGEHARTAGFETAGVIESLADAYLAVGEPDRARDAYADAIAVDANAAESVVDRLISQGQTLMALRVLNRYEEVHGTNAFSLRTRGDLLVRQSEYLYDADLEERYIGLARRAYLEYLAAGYPPEDLDLVEVRIARLYDIAADAGLAVVNAGRALDRFAALDLAYDLLEAGRGIDAAGPFLDQYLAAADPNERYAVAVTLVDLGYLRSAIEVAMPVVRAAVLPPELHVSVVNDLANVILSSGERTEMRRFVYEQLVEPADSLSRSRGELSGWLAEVSDRSGWAARLYGDAARLFLGAGLWAEAAEAASDGLSQQTDDPGMLLSYAIRARTALGTGLSESALEGIVGSAGGDRDAWVGAGRVLLGAGELHLATYAIDRATDPDDADWEVETVRGQLAATGGDLVNAELYFGSALDDVHTQGLDGEISAEIVRAAVGVYQQSGAFAYLDDILTRGMGIRGHERIFQLMRAEARLRAGDSARGIRDVLDLADGPEADNAIQLLAVQGAPARAYMLWDDRTDRMDWRSNDDILVALEPWLFDARGVDTVLYALGRYADGVPSQDAVANVRALTNIVAGRVADAAIALEQLPTESRVREVVMDLVALYASLGAGAERDVTAQEFTENRDGAMGERSRIPAEVLAQVYIQSGAVADAQALLADWHETSEADALAGTLVLAQFDLANGDPERAIARLYEDIVRPYVATDSSERLEWYDRPSIEAGAERAVRMLAGAGLVDEALELADELDAAVQDASPIGRAAIEIAGRAGRGDEMRRRLDAYLVAAGGHPALLLRVARSLLQIDAVDEAAALLAGIVHDGPRNESQQATELWMSCSLLSGDPSYAEQAVVALRERSDTTLLSVEHAARVALSLYQWDLANELFEYVLRQGPGPDVVRLAVQSAYLAGDGERAIELAAEWFPAVFEDGVEELALVAEALGRGPHPHIAAGVWQLVRQSQPANIGVRIEQAIASNRLGDDAGADMLITLLDETNWHPDVAATTLRRLTEQGRPVAAADFAWQVVEHDTLTGALALLAARSLAADGRVPAMYAAIDAGEDAQIDDLSWELGVGAVLLEAHENTAAVARAEGLVALYPDSPAAHLLLARAAATQQEQSVVHAEVQRFIELGGNLSVHADELVGALVQSGNVDGAVELAIRLLDSPNIGVDAIYSRRSSPLLATSVFGALSEGADEAVEALWAQAPDILRYPEMSGMEITLANLYEASGDPAAAMNVYERAIASDSRIWDRAVFYNNLAYVSAVHDINLDNAELLARRSLWETFAFDERDYNTMDTLAWVHFQQGDIVRADNELLSALRMLGMSGDAGWAQARAVLWEHLLEVRAVE